VAGRMAPHSEEKPVKEFNSVASIALTEIEKPVVEEQESTDLDIEKQELKADSDDLKDSHIEVVNNVVDWDGDHDPHNPRNWSTGKKLLNVGIISAASLTSYVYINTTSWLHLHGSYKC